jgi:very-short-patch-repair endonuclease
MVKCKICGKIFKRITPTHLKRHNMTIKEYINIYGKTELLDDYLRNLCDSASKKSFIRRYGYKEGIKKYDEYVEFHKYKNSFEYKKNKYGWDRQTYEAYNKSRAVTKELCIKRHGKKKGKKIYEDYVKKQTINGCKKEYFIDKYGEIEGLKKYKELNKLKGLTVSGGGISVKACKFCETLNEIISDLNLCDIYYHGKDKKEYWLKHPNQNKYFFYDFGIPSLKLLIEFNGNYWHANPLIYNESDYIRNLKAKDIWEYDELKTSLAKSKGFDVITVWENEYDSNPKKVMEKLNNEIRKRL